MKTNFFELQNSSSERLIFISLLITCLLIPNLANANKKGKFRLSLGMDYIEGDFGRNTVTKIKAATLTARYKKSRWTYQASIPYLQIKNATVTLDGVPVPGSALNEDGLGDLILSVAYLGYYDSTNKIGISTKGKIKIPLADENKSLGTGKTDYSLQIDPFWVTGKVTAFSTIGYKVYGDTARTDYNNVGFATLGAMLKLDQDTDVGLGGKFRQNVTQTREDKRELFLFMTRDLDANNKLQGHFLKGFSSASPDWAAGLVIKRTF